MLSLQSIRFVFQWWKMIMMSAGCGIFSVITSRLERSVVIRLPRSLGNDAFDIYSCRTPSLTHLLFALCFIERDESVFPFYCPAWPTLLPQWYIHQTAPAAALMKWSMRPDAGTKDRRSHRFYISLRDSDEGLSISGWAVESAVRYVAPSPYKAPREIAISRGSSYLAPLSSFKKKTKNWFTQIQSFEMQEAEALFEMNKAEPSLLTFDWQIWSIYQFSGLFSI